MASPSSASSRHEENDTEWTRPPKRHKRASTTATSEPSPRELGFMRDPQNDGSATFLGSSSGIHFIRHVYNAFARRSADLDPNRARDRTSVPGEDDRLRRNAGSVYVSDELWEKHELDDSSNLSFEFDDLVQWTRSYFENWHPIFPCLHAPTVLKTMEIISQRGLGAVSLLELMILRSIISVSLGDSRQRTSEAKLKPVPTALVFMSTRHVMQDVQCLLEQPTTLALLQGAFTAQVALTSLLRFNAASRVGGIITRTAFHLGLHRCPGRFKCFSKGESDIRCRLFWSIYSLERYLSQALGIPLSIRDDDIDVCYPGTELHVPVTTAVTSDRRLRLAYHLAKFARIRGLIVELRNKSILHSHASQAEAAHVTGKLAQWWNEVYDEVNPIEDPAEADTSQTPALRPYHRLLLTILRHEAIISLNRPLLAAEKPNADYKIALQTCIGSSRSILTALKRHISTSGSPLSWPCFPWSAWMASLILMYAAWEGELAVSSALKYARMGISVLENLSLRGSGWPETCIEAIKGMESALLTQPSYDLGPKASTTMKNSEQSTPIYPQTVRSADPRETHHPPVQDESESGDPGLTPVASNSAVMNEYQEPPNSAAYHSFPSLAQGPHPGGAYDAAIFAPPDNIGDFSQLMESAGNTMAGQSSAGLIFGNMAGTNPAFNLNFADQDTTIFSNDLWSVADGPWMIHNNFL